MNYLDAFNTLIRERGYESLDNVFMVRSFLSDLIGNSYNDLVLLDAYYLLNQKDLIHQMIRNKNLPDSKEIIKGIINLSDTKYTRVQYIHSVEPLLLLLFPHEYQLFLPKNPQKVGEIHKIGKKKPANITPPLIMPKPVIQPQKVAPIKVKTINVVIKAECRKLTIKNSEKNILVIYDEDGVVVTNVVKKIDANGQLGLRINDTKKDYTIELPKKKYRDIELLFKGRVLKINGLESKTMEYSGYSDFTDIVVNANSFVGGQKVGVFSLHGKIGALNFISEYGKIYGFIEARNNGKYVISSKGGEIDFTFDKTRIRPRVNRLLKVPTCVEGEFQIGSKHIRLSFRTLIGKVRVY